MNPKRKLSRAVPFALGLSVFGAVGAAVIPASSGAVAHTSMAPVTKSGKLVKVLSSASFTMSVGSKSYVVKVDDMTHVTLDSKKVKLSTLKKGDTVTVKGPLEMDTISATSVVAGM